MGNNAIEYLIDGDFDYFVEKAIFNSPSSFQTGWASWPHLITFMTWVGSLIAFNIYKD